MKASAKNPVYSVYITSGSTKFNVTNAVEEISFSDQKKQISKSARVTIGGKSGLSVKARDRVTIYANDGSRNEEVWRGFIWTISRKSSVDGEKLDLKCYDNLIYFQESQESEYFSAGKSTSDIISTLCGNWGVKLQYSYESITHSKLALRGTLSDVITSDILDLVKNRTGIKYTILSEKDTMIVRPVGQNTTVYIISSGDNAISASSESTMDGMTTKVVILGKADDNDRRLIEATVSGDTATYGTLQKLINRESNTALADAKKEAESIIKEDGTPKREYDVVAVDIPWIRKGDKIKVNAGVLSGFYIVNGIERDISKSEKKMTLTLEDVETASATPVTTDAQATGNSTPAAEKEEENPEVVDAKFTLTIKNSGLKTYYGTYDVYVNNILKRSGEASDYSVILNYKDYVKIVPKGKDGYSFNISDAEFNIKDNKTVTISWTR